MKNLMTLGLLFVLSLSFWLFMPGLPLAQNKDIPSQDQKNLAVTTNNYYLKAAKAYFASQDYAKTIETAELAILLEPDSAEAQALLNESRQLLNGKKQTVGTQTPKDTASPPSSESGISSRLEDAHIAIQEARYDDAQALLDSILNTDPLNKDALYLKGTMNDLKHGHVTTSLKTTGAQEKQRNNEYLRESIIPYQDILRYPAEVQWKDIANRRLPELTKIVEDSKKTTDKLRLIPNPTVDSSSKTIEDALNTIISFEFVDTPIKDVVAFLREKTNTNMIVDAEAGNVPITLKLNNVTLRTAFRYLLPKGYEYVIEGDIFHIYRQKMELRVYDVRDILINLDDKEPIKFDITPSSASSALNIEKAPIVKVKDASARILDLIEQIVTTVEPSSWSTHVGIIGATDAGAQRNIRVSGQGDGSAIARVGQPGDLVVVNSKYVHKQIETLLASLRSSQNLQVNIETRFITVTDKFMEDIGSNITELFSKKTSLDTGAADISKGLNLNYSILNNTMVEGFIRALQESEGSEILTSPRITLSNTQRGNISVVRIINYIKGATSSGAGALPEIGVVPEGTTFDVRPVVSADRKYVYLEVTPSVFDLTEPIATETLHLASTSTSVGGTAQAETEITIKLPEVTLSQVSVTVSVPDKGTLMIGGLGSITKSNLTSGIPILSKIPILKTLFSRNQRDDEKKTLIILLKPTIIIREEQEERLFGRSNNTPTATDLSAAAVKHTPEAVSNDNNE